MGSDIKYGIKREYTLYQQTPLIHFQADEPGATLRASEVKPQLDAFLIRRFKKDMVDYSKWTVNQSSGSESKEALDYKLSFRADETQIIELGLKTPYDIFYGNMGKNVIPKKGVLSKQITMSMEHMQVKNPKLNTKYSQRRNMYEPR